MADLIRPRQRALTAVSPHNANANVLIPKRRKTQGQGQPFGATWEFLGGPVVEGVNFDYDEGPLSTDPQNWQILRAGAQPIQPQSVIRRGNQYYLNLDDGAVERPDLPHTLLFVDGERVIQVDIEPALPPEVA